MSHQICFIPVWLALFLLASLPVSADDRAYVISDEQSYLGIDPDAAPKDADTHRLGMELAKRLASSGVDETALVESLTWLTSSTYAHSSIAKLRANKIPDEEIEYEILLDVLLRAGGEPNPKGGAPVRLEYRTRMLRAYSEKSSLRVSSITSFIISDKQRLEWFKKVYQQDKPYDALRFSAELVSKRGKAEVIHQLLSILGNFSGEGLDLAFKQADAYGADPSKLKVLLEEQAAKAKKMDGEIFSFIAERIMESQVMTPAEKLKSLATMAGSGNGNAYKALGKWVSIYRKYTSSGEIKDANVTFPTENSELIAKLIQNLQAGGLMASQLANFSDTEALALANAAVREEIINGQIITALYERKWASDRNASEIASIFLQTKDKAMLGQAVADSLPSLLAHHIMNNYYLLEGALITQARVPAKHIPILLAKLESKDEKHDMHSDWMLALIGLLANSGDKDASKHLHAMLDDTHPMYQQSQAADLLHMRAWVMMHVGSLRPEEVVGFEKAITDELMLNASYYSSYGAARALRGWPAAGKISDELKKAIHAHLLSDAEQILWKDMVTGRFGSVEVNSSSSTKQELLAFIEKGGKQRIQSFVETLDAMTKKDQAEGSVSLSGKNAKQWALELLESLK